MPSTVKLRRVLATQPEKVYRAFLEPDAVASWLPSFGFTCTVHELEAKEGGKHRMSFRNFTTGNSHSFGGTYLKRAGQRRQGSRSAKLAAMNLADGKLLWTREEFGYGTTIGVGDSLLALTENGELVTAKLSPNGYDSRKDPETQRRVPPPKKGSNGGQEPVSPISKSAGALAGSACFGSIDARRTIAPGSRFGNLRYGRLGSLRYESRFLERRHAPRMGDQCKPGTFNAACEMRQLLECSDANRSFDGGALNWTRRPGGIQNGDFITRAPGPGGLMPGFRNGCNPEN